MSIYFKLPSLNFVTGRFLGRRSQFSRQTSTSRAGSRPWGKRGGGGRSPKNVFRPFGPSVWSKNNGGGGLPWIAKSCTSRRQWDTYPRLQVILESFPMSAELLNLTNSQTGLSCSKVDNALHWINLYPVDNAVGFPNTNQLESNSSDC